jgi:hypothetical protein
MSQIDLEMGQLWTILETQLATCRRIMEAFFVCIQESGSHIISEENPILTVSDGCHSWR